jgi:hypothetical protein
MGLATARRWVETLGATLTLDNCKLGVDKKLVVANLRWPIKAEVGGNAE